MVYNSFDIIGDIAIIKHHNIQNPQVVAEMIMDVHRSVKAVFTPTTRIEGDYRIRQLKYLTGEKRTITSHKESGCIFKVDVEKCYFSPRLSNEHKRIAELVLPGETIVNMFAGVGSFSVSIAKTQADSRVYSIDVNPTAVSYMKENVEINAVSSQVLCLLGDSKEIIQEELQHCADRILMPLPEKALEYLPYAVLALKKVGGWIHYYDFQHAQGKEDPVQKAKILLSQKLDSLGVGYIFKTSRIIRTTGPNWYQIVLDVHIASTRASFNSSTCN
jgi:tRNA (guanine37-N1)-methyltransferase